MESKGAMLHHTTTGPPYVQIHTAVLIFVLGLFVFSHIFKPLTHVLHSSKHNLVSF